MKSELPLSEPRIPKPMVLPCVGALVRYKDQFLIVQTTKWKGAWGVPGGKVEYGETLETALHREFLEETGLPLHNLRFLQVQEAIGSSEFYRDTHLLLFDFMAETITDKVFYNDEILQHTWIRLDEDTQFPLNSYTLNLISRVREQNDT